MTTVGEWIAQARADALPDRFPHAARAQLWRPAEHDDVMRENARYIAAAAAEAAIVVAAWGHRGGPVADRLARALLDSGVRLYVLGLTAQGHPRHPLYVRADAALMPWFGREVA